jgi:hypothetical protein
MLLLEIDHPLNDGTTVANPVAASVFDTRLSKPHPFLRRAAEGCCPYELGVDNQLRPDVSDHPVCADYAKKHRAFLAASAWA